MRSYGQYCGVARALDLIGDRWTLLIVRELMIRDGCRIESRMSARLKRRPTVDRSGPSPSPAVPCLWHWAHWALRNPRSRKIGKSACSVKLAM